MNSFLAKQSVEIRSCLKDCHVQAGGELTCAVGMLYKMFGFDMPEPTKDVDQLLVQLKAKIDGLPFPSGFAERVYGTVDGVEMMIDMDEELIKNMNYGYETQNGQRPDYKKADY